MIPVTITSCEQIILHAHTHNLSPVGLVHALLRPLFQRVFLWQVSVKRTSILCLVAVSLVHSGHSIEQEHRRAQADARMHLAALEKEIEDASAHRC